MASSSQLFFCLLEAEGMVLSDVDATCAFLSAVPDSDNKINDSGASFISLFGAEQETCYKICTIYNKQECKKK